MVSGTPKVMSPTKVEKMASSGLKTNSENNLFQTTQNSSKHAQRMKGGPSGYQGGREGLQCWKISESFDRRSRCSLPQLSECLSRELHTTLLREAQLLKPPWFFNLFLRVFFSALRHVFSLMALHKLINIVLHIKPDRSTALRRAHNSL